MVATCGFCAPLFPKASPESIPSPSGPTCVAHCRPQIMLFQVGLANQPLGCSCQLSFLLGFRSGWEEGLQCGDVQLSPHTASRLNTAHRPLVS